MKANLKAEQLVKNYISTCKTWNAVYVNSKTIEDLKKELFQLEWFIPKQCALIAVDEILKIDAYSLLSSTLNDEINYWQQVKNEINKL